MAKLTKGTQLFFINPDDGAVVRVTKLTNFNPGGAPADQVETTDLDALTDKTYLKGLRTPGQATGTINATPSETSHTILHDLAQDPDEEGPIVKWVVGWGDDDTPPTADTNGDWVLPTTRTWFEFEGYVADFPLDFALNTVVQTTLSIQRSGPSKWTPKQ